MLIGKFSVKVPTGSRGGVRTIPACNAVRRGFLHIDFSLCAVIVRSAFAVFTTPRGFKRFRIDL